MWWRNSADARRRRAASSADGCRIAAAAVFDRGFRACCRKRCATGFGRFGFGRGLRWVEAWRVAPLPREVVDPAENDRYRQVLKHHLLRRMGVSRVAQTATPSAMSRVRRPSTPSNKWVRIERLAAPESFDAESSVKKISPGPTSSASKTCLKARTSGFVKPMSAELKIASNLFAMPIAATSAGMVSVPFVSTAVRRPRLRTLSANSKTATSRAAGWTPHSSAAWTLPARSPTCRIHSALEIRPVVTASINGFAKAMPSSDPGASPCLSSMPVV